TDHNNLFRLGRCRRIVSTERGDKNLVHAFERPAIAVARDFHDAVPRLENLDHVRPFVAGDVKDSPGIALDEFKCHCRTGAKLQRLKPQSPKAAFASATRNTSQQLLATVPHCWLPSVK